MMTRGIVRTIPIVFALVLFCGADWLQFRGPGNNSFIADGRVPTDFDVKSGRNVAWRVELPGRGPSSPIVVQGRVIVTCSSGARQDRLHVLAFAVDTGKQLWHRQLWATGHTICNPFGAVAAPTPASDRERIFAFFGSNDLACFDLEGNLKWFRGLAYERPDARNDNGMSSSPVVVDSVVIVQVENEGDSFATGIDVRTGKTKWLHNRENRAIWASPTLLKGRNGGDEVVLMQSASRITAHDPSTGRQVWDFKAHCHTIASATALDKRVYLPAKGMKVLEYDPTSKSVELVWENHRLRSTHSSPLVYNGQVYTIKSGILACGDADDGRVIWQLRLEGSFWATPVIVGEHLFAVSHNGLVHVVQLGNKGKLVGKYSLGEEILGSIAVSDSAMFIRSDAHLMKIAFAEVEDFDGR